MEGGGGPPQAGRGRIDLGFAPSSPRAATAATPLRLAGARVAEASTYSAKQIGCFTSWRHMLVFNRIYSNL